MFVHAVGLAALLASSMPAFADAVMEAERIRATGHDGCPRLEALRSPKDEQRYLGAQAAQPHVLEETAAARGKILAAMDHVRLETCQGLLRDLYRWGVLDNLATGIAFGLINNTTRFAQRAEAIGDHRLRRGHADFVIGFCTATLHIHMANLDRARDLPDVPPQDDAIGPVLESRITRLQAPDTFAPDHCRARIGKLEDANVIDAVANAMLRADLERATRPATSGPPRHDPAQGFDHGLCSAVLNALMGVVGPMGVVRQP